MKKYTLMILTVVMLGALAACSNSEASKDAEGNEIPTIRLGIGYATEEPLWLVDELPEVAKNNGKKYNLEFQQFRANTDRLNAYQAGELEGGSLGQGALIMAADEGVNLKVVASIAKDTPGEGFNFPFMAAEDSGIETTEDLKGKTIGIPDFKSPTDLWARMAVKKAGLDPDEDVSFSVVPPPAVPESIKTDKIDAGLVPQPFYAEIKDSGEFKTVFISKDGVETDEDFLSLFFNPDFINENEEAFEAFIEDYKNTMEYYLDNIEDSRQKLLDAEFVLAEPDVFLDMEDSNRSRDLSLNREGWEKIQDLLLKENWIDEKQNLDDLLETSYIEK